MDKVNPNLPVNKLALGVVIRSEHHGPDFTPNDIICSMAPLPTKQFPGPPKHDLTGRKVGRFTVIGCAVYKRGKHLKPGKQDPGTRWVVRCKCGRYQMLSSKSVKMFHEFAACVECQKTRNLSHITTK